MKFNGVLGALLATALLVAVSLSAVAAAPASTSPESAVNYPNGTCVTVKAGDNLFRISLRMGVSMQALMMANGLRNPNVVYIGQVICSPGGYQQPSQCWYGQCQAPNPSCYYPNCRPYPYVTRTPTPTPGPAASCCGWLGEYFGNMFVGGSPDFVRSDLAVDFNWGDKGPGGGVPGSLWSARWTRTVHFDAGTYRFKARVDDGIRVYVDGQILIDQWGDNPGSEFTADKTLTAGNHTVKVEYYQRGYDAFIMFWWDKL